MVGSPGRRIVSTMRHALAVGALLLAGITQAQTGAIPGGWSIFQSQRLQARSIASPARNDP